MPKHTLKSQADIDALLAEHQMRPSQITVIDEDLCIGCTKCIQACPFDSIVGAAKHMHTVINSRCIGCELCIPPCPVDCIYLAEDTASSLNPDKKRHQAQESYLRRKNRLTQTMTTKANAQQRRSNTREQQQRLRKAAIDAAVKRAKQKKSGLP